jgi:hypothetical protein
MVIGIVSPLLFARSAMSTDAFSPIMPVTSPHLLASACQPSVAIPPFFMSARRPRLSQRFAARSTSRILIRPRPGFYVMRLRSGAPLVPAVIYQLCPMVIPQPTTIAGPHPR